MSRFDVSKAANGYVLMVMFSDDASLLGYHVFTEKADMLKFIEEKLQ